MNVSLDFDLVLYGMMLAALGVLAHWLAPDHGHAALMTGIAGGVLAAFWGVLGLRGFRRRIWPVGTLIVLDMVLLVQAIKAWLAIKNGTEALKPVALILTLLLTFGIGQLVNFLQGRSREK
jgi:hypothetical protein